MMPNIKAFVNKIKEKGKKYNAEQNEKKAKAKGFSSHRSFQTFSDAAKFDGKEKANKQLRKKELDKIEKEAYDDKIQGRSGKYHKYQKKVIKGIQIANNIGAEYNEIIGGFKAIGGNNNEMYPQQPSKQSYASGYGLRKSNKKGKKRKPQKKKSKSKKPKHAPKNDFWNQFM